MPPANTLVFMHPGFGRFQRANESETKAERCFFLNRGRNHLRDSVKIPTSSGLTRGTRKVTWEMERVPIIETGLNMGTAATSAAWETDWHVRYVPPVPTLPPVLPVTPEMWQQCHL